ncbi:hypothetical protein WAK64_10535 [Bacillus spongiae]|uniref:Phosphatase n=1 Tax=Bacillus spongiae TaxID=2683610 RepID=A0ABU8HDQ1_9BACI
MKKVSKAIIFSIVMISVSFGASNYIGAEELPPVHAGELPPVHAGELPPVHAGELPPVHSTELPPVH